MIIPVAILAQVILVEHFFRIFVLPLLLRRVPIIFASVAMSAKMKKAVLVLLVSVVGFYMGSCETTCEDISPAWFEPFNASIPNNCSFNKLTFGCDGDFMAENCRGCCPQNCRRRTN